LGLELVADDVVVLLAEEDYVCGAAAGDDVGEGHRPAGLPVLGAELTDQRRAAAGLRRKVDALRSHTAARDQRECKQA
jgi:hypothetical protein